ncbi:DUF6228 family protein [Streptomyces sp. H62]
MEGTWRSLEDDLTLSAEHAGSQVRLTRGLHDRLPDDEWRFEMTHSHAPGEDMRSGPWCGPVRHGVSGSAQTVFYMASRWLCWV